MRRGTRSWSRRSRRAALALGAAALTAVGGALPAGATTVPKIDVTLAETRSTVVLVESEASARFTVPGVNLNEAELRNELVARVRNKTLAVPTSQEESLADVFTIAASDPKRFIVLDPKEVSEGRDVFARATGNGVLVSGTGTVVTAGSLVAEAPLVERMTVQGRAALKDQLAREDTGAPAALAGPFAAFANAAVDTYATLGPVTVVRHVQLGPAKPGIDGPQRHTATLAPAAAGAAPSSAGAKRLGVLTVDGLTGTPAAPLAKAAAKVGDLTVVGYPVTDTTANPPATLAADVPGATAVTTSPGVDGAIGLVTSAATPVGSPMFDAQGHLRGIVTGSGPGSSEPLDAVSGALANVGLQPGLDAGYEQYRKELAEERADHWRSARKRLDAIKVATPQHPYLAEHVAAADKAIAEGRDRSGRPIALTGLALVVASLAAAATGAVGVLDRSRRPAATGTDEPVLLT